MASTTFDEREGRYEIAIGETLDYTLDYNDPVELYLGDDTIQSSSWVVGDGLTLENSTNGDTTATAWVSVDTADPGDTVFITNTIETVGGRTAVRALEIVVVARKP